MVIDMKRFVINEDLESGQIVIPRYYIGREDDPMLSIHKRRGAVHPAEAGCNVKGEIAFEIRKSVRELLHEMLCIHGQIPVGGGDLLAVCLGVGLALRDGRLPLVPRRQVDVVFVV